MLFGEIIRDALGAIRANRARSKADVLTCDLTGLLGGSVPFTAIRRPGR